MKKRKQKRQQKPKSLPSATGSDVGRHISIFQPFGGRASGVRRVATRVSPVLGFAGPVSEVKKIVEFGELERTPSVYLLELKSTTAQAHVYVGRTGDGERRLAEQVSKYSCEHLYVVRLSHDESVQHARFTELRLYDECKKQGIKLANRMRPNFFRTMEEMTDTERADHECLFRDELDAFCFLGFRNLEKSQALPKTESKAEPPATDVRLGSIKIPAKAPEYELSANSLWARGFQVDNRFYVMPGSEYCINETDSLHKTISDRRNPINELENREKRKILVPIRGSEDRLRLVAWLDCDSMAIAGKLLTGWQTNSSVWKKVPRHPLVYATDLRP
jgi:hypothetical protein